MICPSEDDCDKELSIHEQAVWMLLSQAELQSPGHGISQSMASSWMVDSSPAGLSALDDDLQLMVGFTVRIPVNSR